MSLICKIVIAIYLILCALSLALIPLSNAGLFGIEPDPLAGVYAILLGQPWSSLTGPLASDHSTVLNMALVGAGMLLNAAILALLCRFFRNLKSSN